MTVLSSLAADELPLVRAAQQGDEQAFRELVERHRPLLHAHCYRMLASPHDADDAVQEALVRAWRGLPGFQGASSLSTWLTRIATNTAIDVARRRGRRALPVGSCEPVGPGGAPMDVDYEANWMGPYPSSHHDPELSFLEREALEVAYVAALQHLPVQQRAVFLLREVFRYPAAEVAEMLETTVAGVNSRLQRARAELRKWAPASQQSELVRLGDSGVRELAARYARAIEEADLATLFDLLAEDPSWSMPPIRGWFKGRDAVRGFLVDSVFRVRWQHRFTWSNGQPAVAGYLYDDSAGCYVAAALDVLDLQDGKIVAVTAFLTPAGAPPHPGAETSAGQGLFSRFGLPEQLAA